MTATRWRVVLWLTAVAFVLWLGYAARGALVPFAVGGAIGYAMLPLVERLAAVLPIRREPIRRGVAVFLVYVLFGLVVVYAIWMLAPIIADQVSRFIDALPALISAANESFSHLFEQYRQRVPEETRAQIDAYVRGIAGAVAAAVTGYVQRSFTFVTSTVSILFGYFVVPFWLFYMLRDRRSLQRGFLRAMPPAVHDDVHNAFVMVDDVIGRYIRAQLLLGLVVGTAVGVTLSLLDVQLAVGLGVWAGLMEIVPIIGPWLGAIPGLLIVAGTNPQLLLPVALVYLLVQQLENQLLVPRIQGEAADISAGIVILLLVMGGAAFGFAGLVVAVPAAAILRELFWYLDRRLRGASPRDAFAESRAARHRSARAAAKPVPQAAAEAEPASTPRAPR